MKLQRVLFVIAAATFPFLAFVPRPTYVPLSMAVGIDLMWVLWLNARNRGPAFMRTGVTLLSLTLMTLLAWRNGEPTFAVIISGLGAAVFGLGAWGEWQNMRDQSRPLPLPSTPPSVR